jgi:hypothetical protein
VAKHQGCLPGTCIRNSHASSHAMHKCSIAQLSCWA